MLETIDQVEFSRRQRPANAPPGEVAAALRALAFAVSDADADQAYHRVLYSVGNDHSGSYFPIVLDIVPYLGEILVVGAHRTRARALDVLIDLLASFGPDPDVLSQDDMQPEQLPVLLKSRVESLRPILENLVSDQSESEVPRLAQDLLKCLDDRG